MSLNKDNRGIALFPQGVREYEVIDNHALRLTLFRTYSFMGKENLIYRPGRASGERIIETPDAELLKPLDFSFGFMSFSQSFNNSLIANYAKEYNTPVIAKEYAEFLNGRLIFSEMEYDNVVKVRGMDIVLVTTAKTDEEAYDLLDELGIPFRK